MLVSGLLDRLWQEAYQLVVGKFYSPATLGQYTRSKHYAALFSSNLNKVVMQVSYPVLSSIQEDKERMVSAYRKIIKTTMFVTAICMLFLAGISEPMIRVLIGDKWLQAASFLPLICISMSLYPLHAINLNMLKVLGRSDLFLIYEILKKIIAIAPICLGIFVGIYAMLIGSIVAGIMSFFINSWYTGKKLGYTSWKQIKDIVPNYAIGTIVALSIYFLKYLPFSPFAILPIQIIIGIFVFVFVAEMTKLQQYNDLKEIVCKGFSKIWKK
jgi:O-antigen/teichoic acid export membrane protein